MSLAFPTFLIPTPALINGHNLSRDLSLQQESNTASDKEQKFFIPE